MALKIEVESLEGIDEAYQGLYKEKEGKFTLDVEGLPDTTGLKTALEKERKTVKELKGEFSKFKNVDLEEYADLQARAASLAEHDPEKIKEMIDQRVSQNDKAWKEKYEDLMGSVRIKDEKLSDVMISNELRKVGEELGVNGPEAMNDFVSRGKSIFRLKDDMVVPVKGDDIIYGESGVEPLTMVEFGKKLSETAKHLFKPSGGGGATTTGSGQAGSGTVRYKSDLKTDAEKAAYIGKHGRTAYLELPRRAEG